MRENQSLKEQLQKYQEEDQNSRREMAHSIEEAEKIITEQKSQLKEKEEICQAREVEIVSLRREFEQATNNMNASLKFDKISSILDDILRSQRYPFIKTGLGYDGKQKTVETGEGSCLKEIMDNQTQNYANALRNGEGYNEKNSSKNKFIEAGIPMRYNAIDNKSHIQQSFDRNKSKGAEPSRRPTI